MPALATAVKDNANNPSQTVVMGVMDRALPPQTIVKKYGGYVAAVITAMALLAFLFARYGHADTLWVDPDQLTLSPVKQGGFQEFVPVTGAVAPIDSVFVDVAEPGLVEAVLVEAGNKVEVGQLLIRLSSTAPENELMASETLLAQQVNQLSATQLQYSQTRLNTQRSAIDMRAALERLTTHHTRLMKLNETGAIRQADIDDQKIEIKRLQQSLAATEQSLVLSETEGKKQIATMQRVIDNLTQFSRQRIESLQVKAPISGMLTNFDIHVGQRVLPSQHLGQIDQIDRNKIVASIDQFYLNRVALNQSATALVSGSSYELKVTKIYPEVRQSNFRVDLIFDSHTPPAIKIGQTIELRLNIGASAIALTIAKGPFYDTSTQSVFVVDKSGATAERRSVKLGRHNIEQIEILSGLSPGEKVVTSSYERFAGINQLRFH
jgi:HlyD family secretion protein